MEKAVKLFQLLLAFIGGSVAIYLRLEGYAVAVVAVGTAYLGTIALTRASEAWRNSQQRNDSLLRERDTLSGE